MTMNEKILENVNATMSMEDLPLNQEDKDRIMSCLEGRNSFKSAISSLINKYQQNNPQRDING
ncbi:MAG: hypothetical protein ACI4V7_00440 [Succinivibrionaceae bacterium]